VVRAGRGARGVFGVVREDLQLDDLGRVTMKDRLVFVVGGGGGGGGGGGVL